MTSFYNFCVCMSMCVHEHVCVCLCTYILDSQVTRFWLPFGGQDRPLSIWMISQHATAGSPSKQPTHCAMDGGQILLRFKEENKSSLIWFIIIWSYINSINLLHSSYTWSRAHTFSTYHYPSCLIVYSALASWTQPTPTHTYRSAH